MSDYKYTLDNSKPTKLFRCPCCDEKQLKLYLDTETNSYLDENVGRCNREINCGYHLKPKDFFTENSSLSRFFKKDITTIPISKVIIPFSEIEQRYLEKSMTANVPNNFMQFLENIFTKPIAENLKNRFKIGSAKYYDGGNIFWQIDEKGKMRTGKIMLYNAKTGKRVKEKSPTWVHSVMKLADFHLCQCLFGLHQLTTEPSTKPIAIVESEKTAMLMTVVFNKFIWLATGGKNISTDKFNVLSGRKITLFPDLNCFNDWNSKANELRMNGLTIQVSDFLEKNATDEQRANGFDLADFYIHTKIDKESGLVMAENGYPLFWDFFNNI